uniref:Uncharacterized protein n=1 Tax=Micrurus lemniscatus lemniscatus TaxID=129467 RepID=A0A2D4JJL5_MICLE
MMQKVLQNNIMIKPIVRVPTNAPTESRTLRQPNSSKNSFIGYIILTQLVKADFKSSCGFHLIKSKSSPFTPNHWSRCPIQLLASCLVTSLLLWPATCENVLDSHRKALLFSLQNLIYLPPPSVVWQP